ncbi:hypothetical protein EJB05_44380 [Eragrostis curvula]|uniref:Secreted protein n=1 Tax=Eragrostis curvula TaxID=38414 RepID=A0A5J9TIX2_9POAL|nr:hypothetical protein EJB05_44380 [Eragrostis curvula]
MSWKMGPTPKAFVLLLLVAQGHGQGCDPRNIVVDQSMEGKKGIHCSVSVLILNHCRCAISNLHVRANGFSSSEPVDPSAFRRRVTSRPKA